jgi:metallo-beta-lactamase family protein
MITHLGGEQSVTGSCHLLRLKGINILIDCGRAQGNDTVIPMETWPVRPSEIHYLFLTHAHIDHIGRVPELIQQGFGGEIISTQATKALIQYMLEDAVKFDDLPHAQRNLLLKTLDDLSRAFEYDQRYHLKAGIHFKLRQAGHILGSCFIQFEWNEPTFSVVFSGDLGASYAPILPDPAIPDPCNLLIMESTYGDRCHTDRRHRIQRLGDVLTRSLSDGGKVLIPAFSLGRTQELIYEMDRLFSDPTWRHEFPALNSARSQIPVFIDSPLGQKITTVYSNLSEFWDQEAQEIFHSTDHPLDFAHLYTVNTYQEHQELVTMPGPAVIIAGSGMCTGGRILDHLKAGLNDPKNDVLFVGYQAYGTPGRDIIRYSQKPEGYVRLDREKMSIRANIHVLSGYSAHADQRDLLHWVQAMSEKPKAIKLIHGEAEAQRTLRNELLQRGYHVHP